MRPALRSTLIAMATAAFLAVLEILRSSLTRVLDGHPFGDTEFWRRVVPMGITLVAVSPWCAFMAARFPLRPGRTLTALVAHAGGAAIFVALHLALLIGLHVTLGHHRPFLGMGVLLHTYVFYVALEASLYVGIVAILLLLGARREAEERAVATARLAESLAAARLAELQSQIRPHFLFNTLNVLAVLARRGDGAAVDRALGDLGELLRASFREPGRHEIALREELQFLERYVDLQRLRFPDRLEVEWAVSDEARDALVPSLVVQPLVENAIEHGLTTAQGGRVRVVARREGDDLVVEVTDDGPGFAAGAVTASAGVGLANTRERLRLLYGERGTLSCGDPSAPGGRVTIRLPWRRVHPAAGAA
jgi:hypothetical protein